VLTLQGKEVAAIMAAFPTKSIRRAILALVEPAVACPI
jgi:hypothetical protein